MSTYDFSSALEQIDFSIDGEKFVLKELSGDDCTLYKNRLSNSARMSEGKIVGVTNPGDMEVVLLELVVFNSDGSRVSKDVVRKWKSSIRTTLFTKAMKLSGLQDDEETVKNDYPTNEDGSS